MNRIENKNNLTFHSSLSIEQIECNFADVDFYSELTAGLEQAIAYERGEEVPGILVRTVSRPDNIPAQEEKYEK